MTGCTHLLPPDDHACGRPIFAIWQRRDGLMTGLCETHDRIALRACALDPQLWVDFDRLPLAQSVNAGRGDPPPVGATA